MRKYMRHYPQVREMLAQSSKCAVCGESFLNTWLECVQFVDAHRVSNGFPFQSRSIVTFLELPRLI